MITVSQTRPRPLWKKLALAVGLLLLVAAVAASAYAYARFRQAIDAGVYAYLHPARRPSPPRPAATAATSEAFTVTASDGARLVATFYHADAPGGTVIILHGYHGREEDSIGLAGRLNGWGYNAVAYSSRAHGASTGSMVTFGYKEKTDAAAVLRAVRQRYDPKGPYAMVGTSMGSSVIAQALPLVPELSCAVLFCPFASMQEMIDLNLSKRTGFWQNFLALQMRGVMEKQLSFNLAEINPINGIRVSPVPVLIVHGTRDETIPARFGRELFDASPSPKKQWLLVAGAGHGNLLAGDEPWAKEVTGEFRSFLDANLRAASAR